MAKYIGKPHPIESFGAAASQAGTLIINYLSRLQINMVSSVVVVFDQ
jgi:hypothetical protein